jgi:hypothetical protein
MQLMGAQNSLRRWLLLVAVLLGSQWFAPHAVADDDDGPVVGVVQWAPGLLRDANSWDKTDLWAGIAISPSTGKFAASCEWSNRDNADREAREKCNAKDARLIVLCCNGWCALALGKREEGKDVGWGVGWGPNQREAERFALEEARDQKLTEPKVVYSINAREMRTGGAIAFSESTGDWGYATGGGPSSTANALANCNAPDAKVIAQKSNCWMALALGDDTSAYGWGYAGNRDDAESFALTDCNKQTKNAKIVVSFCTNGVEH